jgi:hypothetical protein
MNECLIWASLSDKLATGEPVSAEERLYLRSHPTTCTACATEASLWENLERVVAEPDLLTTWPSDLDSAAPGSSQPLSPGWWRSRRPALLAAFAVVAAAAASAALANWSSEPARVESGPAQTAAKDEPGAGFRVQRSAGARLALAAGETFVNQRAAVAGERLDAGAVVSVAAGEACVLVPPGVTVCLAQGTVLSVERLDARTRRFRLHAGEVAAHLLPQPAGSSFGFETPAGSVVAKGTVFSLKTDGSSVTLRVHEGVVLSSQGTATSAYRAPSAALLSPETRSQRPVETGTSADSRLVDLASYYSDRAQSSLSVSAAAGSSVVLDGFSLGIAPISALVAPGSYRMEVSRPGHAPIVERLAFETGSDVSRSYETTAELAPTGTRASPSAAADSAAPSPAVLLQQAQGLRAGDHYLEASQVYRRLLKEYSSSAEARVALVSLGELQLSQLGDANGALRSFESYLSKGGALRQEASYGRIRALRRLGKVSQARAASQAFIEAYPNSVQATTLRKEMP